MQLTAKLTQILPIQTGNGKNGIWKKQDIILETVEQFPKKACVTLWGDKIDEGQLQIGNSLKIDFDIISREYNSRWYTEIKANKIDFTTYIPKMVLMFGKPETIALASLKVLERWNCEANNMALLGNADDLKIAILRILNFCERTKIK